MSQPFVPVQIPQMSLSFDLAEELSDMRKQMKALEEKNVTYMKETMNLQEVCTTSLLNLSSIDTCTLGKNQVATKMLGGLTEVNLGVLQFSWAVTFNNVCCISRNTFGVSKTREFFVVQCFTTGIYCIVLVKIVTFPLQIKRDA